MRHTDFLIIGGGIIGISIARELKKRFTDADVMLIEKEGDIGLHASGRNSGVLHAGFYYTPDSLKARFTRVGNAALTEYCEDRNIHLNKCGKLVVAKDPGELAILDTLLERGRKNGILLHAISEEEAREIEPRVKTCGRALYSPTTSSVDPVKVVQAMKQDAIAEGVDVVCGTRFIDSKMNEITTTTGEVQAGYVINAAGLYADRIARKFGFSNRYRILPFKGLYLYSNEPAGSLRMNIYPVPDLKNPFLGVHFTVAENGVIKIGPTAIPALWREHYNGIENFSPAELFEIIARQSRLFWTSDFDFKKLAFDEIRKYSRARMIELASALAEGVDIKDYTRWGQPGVRAQLVDIVDNKLEMDFVIEGDGKSLHVLNAVSPAFTCAIPFSQHVCDKVQERLN